mmetsp:Transcript_4924/g.14954  ORF Transcript_4924/g.14954 Transcript_4924/m.14954 type:complete len:365 (+) Transcript_4924:1055-2149(+)
MSRLCVSQTAGPAAAGSSGTPHAASSTSPSTSCTSRLPCSPVGPRSTSTSSMPGGSRRTSACASSIAARLRSSGAAGAVVSAGDRLTTSSQCSPIAPARSASATGTTTVRLAGDITTTGVRMLIGRIPCASMDARAASGLTRQRPPGAPGRLNWRGESAPHWTHTQLSAAVGTPHSCSTSSTGGSKCSSMILSGAASWRLKGRISAPCTATQPAETCSERTHSCSRPPSKKRENCWFSLWAIRARDSHVERTAAWCEGTWGNFNTKLVWLSSLLGPYCRPSCSSAHAAGAAAAPPFGPEASIPAVAALGAQLPCSFKAPLKGPAPSMNVLRGCTPRARGGALPGRSPPGWLCAPPVSGTSPQAG